MKLELIPVRNMGNRTKRSIYSTLYRGIIDCCETHYSGKLTRAGLSYYGEDLYSRTEHTSKGRVRMPLFRTNQQTIEPMPTPVGLAYAINTIYNSGGNLNEVVPYTSTNS